MDMPNACSLLRLMYGDILQTKFVLPCLSLCIRIYTYIAPNGEFHDGHHSHLLCTLTMATRLQNKIDEG